MPRPLRNQSAGIRHVTCRGNRGQPIFLDELDHEWYLRILEHTCEVLSWRVHGWCLMTNHVHLVLDVPDETLSRGMQLLCGDYAQGFNWRHGYTGHLFQGRFHSAAITEGTHLLEAIRYVDLNPERAGLVDRADEWPWSGHRAHLGLETPRPFHDISWARGFGMTTEGAAEAYAEHVEVARRTRPFRT